MSPLQEYALFFAKSVTIVAVVLIPIMAVSLSKRRDQGDSSGRLRVRRLDDVFRAREAAIRAQLKEDGGLLSAAEVEKKEKDKTGTGPPQARGRLAEWTRSQLTRFRPKPGDGHKGARRIYVLNFRGDIRARAVEALREEITAMLAVARPGEDEAVLRLESPGGVVPAYGLAASQLARVRDAGVHLTVCVDRVAASGGYLMAAVADRILAAPFALVGSIGVVGALPNFHRWLKKHDIDFEQHTAGTYKRTLTLFGENTEEDRQKFRDDLEAIHGQFKGFIHHYRPQLDLERTATGEFWLGERALELGLVDQIQTSDDYLMKRRHEAILLELHFHRRERWSQRWLPLMERLATWIRA